MNIINPKKSQVVILQTKKNEKICKNLKDIVDLYNLKSGSDMSKKGERLKILTNQQMLNRLPVLLAQIQAENNSKKFKK